MVRTDSEPALLFPLPAGMGVVARTAAGTLETVMVVAALMAMACRSA